MPVLAFIRRVENRRQGGQPAKYASETGIIVIADIVVGAEAATADHKAGGDERKDDSVHGFVSHGARWHRTGMDVEALRMEALGPVYRLGVEPRT
jgi:hypothetical protein